MSLENVRNTDCAQEISDPKSEAYDPEIADLLRRVDETEPQPKGPYKSPIQKFADGAFEYWVNNLLGLPTTQLKNIGSTTMAMSLRIPETIAAASISKVMPGTGEKVYFSEAVAEAQGLAEGGGDIIRFLANRFSPENNSLPGGTTKNNEEILASMKLPTDLSIQSKIEFKKRAITGKNIDNAILRHGLNYIGSAVNIPGKLLTTTDVLFKIMNYRMSSAKFAMRQTLEEGLAGDDAHKRYLQLMNEVREDRNVALRDKGVADADYRVYTNMPEGKLNQWMAKEGHYTEEGRGVPYLRWIVPFRRTMVNVMNYSMERSPLAPAQSKTRRMLFKGTNAERSEALGRMSLGTMLIVGTYGLLGDRISGEPPQNQHLKDMWEGQGNKRDSLRIGNEFIHLDALGPLAPFLKTLARFSDFASNRPDTLEASEEEDAELIDMATELTFGIADALLQEHWLPNLAGAMATVQRAMYEQSADPLIRSAGGMAASFVPRPVQLWQEATDETEYKDVGPLDEFYSRIPTVANGQLEPKINFYGEEQIHSRFKQPYPDDPFFKEVTRLGIELPEPEMKSRGVNMSGKEYRIFKELVGKGGVMGLPPMKDQMEYIINHDSYKNKQYDDGRIAMIRKAIRARHKTVRDWMMYYSDWGEKAQKRKVIKAIRQHKEVN